MKRMIFATGNVGKLKEVKKLFAEFHVEILSLKDLENPPEIIENGKTFEENSLIKARTVFADYGVPVFADDSGLVVEQLGGAPGVYSARYAGEKATYAENNKKLLEELKRFPEPHQAKFVCVASYVDGEREFTVRGELPGKIVHEFRGENGFGYDPIFIPKGYDRTLAELSLEEKNKISHRGQAMAKLKNELLRLNLLE
jgi:XTP/dITP diphosphohydrolase